MNHKPKIVVYDDFGRKIWQQKEADVEKLYSKNTPNPRFNPDIKETLKKIDKKLS